MCGVAQADTAQFQKCVAISDSAERLFCYDQVASGLPAPEIAPTVSTKPSTPVPTQVEAAPPQAPEPEPTTVAAVAKTPEESFGLELQEVKEAQKNLKEIRSRYKGYFEGSRGKGTRFELENGQVWRQTEAETITQKGESPMMIISRGSFGGYRLRLEGSKRTVRVERIK